MTLPREIRCQPPSARPLQTRPLRGGSFSHTTRESASFAVAGSANVIHLIAQQSPRLGQLCPGPLNDWCNSSTPHVHLRLCLLT